MVYLDTSVALAHLLGEDRYPPASLWAESLVSSRLLQYELWVRLNALDLGPAHADAARQLIGRVALIELVPRILTRVLEPFPAPIRTLDALHLAWADFLRRQGQEVLLATYDDRQRDVARDCRTRRMPAPALRRSPRHRPDRPGARRWSVTRRDHPKGQTHCERCSMNNAPSPWRF